MIIILYVTFASGNMLFPTSHRQKTKKQTYGKLIKKKKRIIRSSIFFLCNVVVGLLKKMLGLFIFDQ